MKKIAVIGSPGAGKSTFSRELGRLLGIEVIHLDYLYWHPGWIETPKHEWQKKMKELVKRPEWIIDGHYGSTLNIRIEAADTVISRFAGAFVPVAGDQAAVAMAAGAARYAGRLPGEIRPGICRIFEIHLEFPPEKTARRSAGDGALRRGPNDDPACEPPGSESVSAVAVVLMHN